MGRRRQATISDLRQAIECLPRGTRLAMLEGIRTNEIIVGAYTDGSGVCPMLAAHRAGGRTNLISFARAWDRFAFRGTRVQAARRATDRELLVLKTHLEATLLEQEDTAAEIATAIAQHRDLLEARGAASASAAPEPDRARELRRRERSSWVRIFRRRDVYGHALGRLAAEREAVSERELARQR